MNEPTLKRRSGGRTARVAKRAASLPVNPAPPGQEDGMYRPLSDMDLRDTYNTALRLLAKIGMGEVPDRLRDDLIRGDAVQRDEGRVTFPNAMVEDCIAKTAKKFTLHGRDPDRSIEVGGDKVYFGTSGAAVNTLDLKTGRYRPSALRNLHDFTRLQDTLDNVA